MKKTRHIKLLLLFAFIIFLAFSCKKKNKDSDPVIVENKNVMTAKINGIDFKDCKKYMLGQMSGVEAIYYPDQRLTVTGKQNCVFELPIAFPEIVIFLKKFDTIGTYQLDTGNMAYLSYYYNNQMNDHILSTDLINNGFIKITNLDNVKGKISAIFEFNVFYPDSNKVITITEGVLENVYYDLGK